MMGRCRCDRHRQKRLRGSAIISLLIEMTDAGKQTTDLAGQADDGAGEIDEEQEQEGQAELLWHVTQAKQAPASPNQGRRAAASPTQLLGFC